ncbi:hypothetical protein [Nocardioides sp. MH1]|uniref:hypothetical protein n=1 Tax=Nocardioides sp. MH1 TaxID=3242490 RepID=UPI003521B593
MIYLLANLGSIVQVIFMIVRGGAIITLLAFEGVTAAGTASAQGWLRFKRVGMLIVGFVLYKPVAALVYGVGIRLLSDGADTDSRSSTRSAG